MDNLSDDEVTARYNEAILKAKPEDLSDEELDLRLQLAQESNEQKFEPFSAKKLAGDAADYLPFAGGVAGGMLGFASPVPGGAVLGSGGGAMLGEAARQGIQQGLLGYEKKGLQQNLEDIGWEGVAGVAGEALPIAASKIVKPVVKKVGSALSRIPEKVIETYLERGKDVDKLIKEYGGDTPQAADAIREQINRVVSAFKSKQNTKISNALKNTDEVVDVSGAIDVLEQTASRLDPDIDAHKIARINNEIKMVTDVISQSGGNGYIPAQRAFSLQKRLQDAAEYLEPGQLVRKGDPVIDTGFAKAANRVRVGVNRVAPDIAEANKEWSKLHRVNKSMNKGLLKEGAAEAGLINAGSGEASRASRSMGQLGEVVGKDFMPDLELLAAQKNFAKPTILTPISTGAALLPGAYGLAGKNIADEMGMDPEMATYLGIATGLLGSPMGLKYGIKGARLTPRLIRNAPGYLGARGLLKDE